MPRKLLTFVGATPYKHCVYQTQEGYTSPVVRFVQEALVGMVCRDWTTADTVYVFLTSDAEQQNWLGNKYRNDPDDRAGLHEKLEAMHLSCRIIPVGGFKEGFSEQQIWENFQKIYDCLEADDELWLDITNAFRSIPLFASVLLNYARFLKNTRLKAVYYGAFDAIGPAYDIETRLPDPTDRIVPLLNIASVIELQEWTNAANDFLTHGNAKELAGRSAHLGYHDLSHALSEVTEAFAVVRGSKVVQGDIFENLQQTLQQLSLTTPIPVLPPILEKVAQAFRHFELDAVHNGFLAAQWCYEHQLYQQGITLLRETIVTLICQEAGLPENDYASGRKYVETAFNCYGRDRDEWNIPDKRIQPQDLEDLIAETKIPLFAGIYQDLSHKYRNDINHGGFVRHAKAAGEFALGLKEALQQIQKLFNH